eukprot:gnl/MRDRNA2_/MRDRNA2_75667_c0_seq2.p1 gnl/MRDRNA2_/MRDRNA2_75667_c0~~gnl/MRDRNA2_/MRDRNA2_75667_c0_seq2.p1  ORF type:complete len:360 (+),score=76.97 gnl/MRDRNA2_/MRDRNA2_75667_c0_seq2:116-1195(+)
MCASSCSIVLACLFLCVPCHAARRTFDNSEHFLRSTSSFQKMFKTSEDYNKFKQAAEENGMSNAELEPDELTEEDISGWDVDGAHIKPVVWIENEAATQQRFRERGAPPLHWRHAKSKLEGQLHRAMKNAEKHASFMEMMQKGQATQAEKTPSTGQVGEGNMQTPEHTVASSSSPSSPSEDLLMDPGGFDEDEFNVEGPDSDTETDIEEEEEDDLPELPLNGTDNMGPPQREISRDGARVIKADRLSKQKKMTGKHTWAQSVVKPWTWGKPVSITGYLCTQIDVDLLSIVATLTGVPINALLEWNINIGLTGQFSKSPKDGCKQWSIEMALGMNVGIKVFGLRLMIGFSIWPPREKSGN